MNIMVSNTGFINWTSNKLKCGRAATIHGDIYSIHIGSSRRCEKCNHIRNFFRFSKSFHRNTFLHLFFNDLRFSFLRERQYASPVPPVFEFL